MQENGQEYVILPVQEYKKLLAFSEDVDDVAAFDMAKARGEEAFPMHLYDAIDAGENPVRVFREYRKMNQKALAAEAGISEAYLSQIEGGRRQGSAKTMKAIARVLNVEMDDLVI